MKGVQNKAFSWALIFVGIIVTVYSAFTLAYNLSFGKVLIAGGVFLSMLGVIKLYLLRHIEGKTIKAINKVLNLVIIIPLIIFVIAEAVIIPYSFKSDRSPSPYVLVLGAGLRGETPSLTLVQRLEAAEKLAKENTNCILILSGGQGPGESVTEAYAMKKFLMSRGVSEDRLLIEDKSTNTKENVNNSAALIASKDGNKSAKVTIITNGFHIYRSMLLGKRAGLNCTAYSAETLVYLIPAYYMRESAALIKSFIFDR